MNVECLAIPADGKTSVVVVTVVLSYSDEKRHLHATRVCVIDNMRIISLKGMSISFLRFLVVSLAKEENGKLFLALRLLPCISHQR